MSRALDRTVVTELTTEFWSSLGVALLADFGADVVRVERFPEALHPVSESVPEAPMAGWDHRHELANRNKRSLAVDLTREPGRLILQRLIAHSDVFVTDQSPSLLAREGWDYPSLSALNPGLIYARASGFGPRGPDCDLPALDELAAARTGMMPILPQPGQPPVYTGAGQMYTSVMLAFGLATALYHRRRTGEGQEVDVSLFAGNMYGASLDLQAYLAIGGERLLHPIARTDAGNPMSGTLYRTRDERWVTLTMPDTDRWWSPLAKIVGLDADDPRFDTHEKRCELNRLELIRVLEEAFRRHPADRWRALFTEHQLSADVIEDYSFPIRDEQAFLNRYILDLNHPSTGPIKMLGFPIFMSESPARMRTTAPRLGQDSAEILRDMLFYPQDRIKELEASGIIARAVPNLG